MEKNLKHGGIKGSHLTALQSLKQIICSKPRMLTGSEIKLLKQSKTEIARRVAYLVNSKKYETQTFL